MNAEVLIFPRPHLHSPALALTGSAGASVPQAVSPRQVPGRLSPAQVQANEVQVSAFFWVLFIS
jgi:hypothetical protein